MRGEGATHAWVEAYIPHHGWIGIDPTNNVWATNNHVKLAVGRDFSDCTPAKGTFKGPAKQSLSVYVSVGYEDGQVFEEITDVKWFSRDEFQASVLNGTLILPPRISVARRMVEYWFGGEIESGESWRP